jgi:hypothetical protein
MRIGATLGLASALAVLLLSSACGPAGEKILEKAETSIKKGLDAAFNAVDKNGDGKITMKEFATAEEKLEKDVEETFKTLDDDGNGVLTRDEFQKMFDKIKKAHEHLKDEAAEPKGSEEGTG